MSYCWSIRHRVQKEKVGFCINHYVIINRKTFDAFSSDLMCFYFFYFSFLHCSTLIISLWQNFVSPSFPLTILLVTVALHSELHPLPQTYDFTLADSGVSFTHQLSPIKEAKSSDDRVYYNFQVQSSPTKYTKVIGFNKETNAKVLHFWKSS